MIRYDIYEKIQLVLGDAKQVTWRHITILGWIYQEPEIEFPEDFQKVILDDAQTIVPKKVYKNDALLLQVLYCLHLKEIAMHELAEEGGEISEDIAVSHTRNTPVTSRPSDSLLETKYGRFFNVKKEEISRVLIFEAGLLRKH